ncbi:MAG: hypothetical protein ACI9IP_003030, partial [Arcticibacterium sp.]
MPIVTTTLLTGLTLSHVVKCIVDEAIATSPSSLGQIPQLAKRLKKKFSDTKPEVNGHLQKAILSAHWMATTVFV